MMYSIQRDSPDSQLSSITDNAIREAIMPENLIAAWSFLNGAER